MTVSTKRYQSRVRLTPNYYVDVRMKCQILPFDPYAEFPRHHCIITITSFKSTNEIPQPVLDLVGKKWIPERPPDVDLRLDGWWKKLCGKDKENKHGKYL